jgi:hypothetical protein
MEPVSTASYAYPQVVLGLLCTFWDLATHPNSRAVVTVPLGGGTLDGERFFLWAVLQDLNVASYVFPSEFKRLAVVIAAGNGQNDQGLTGLDLTSMLNQFHDDYPNLFGALDGSPHVLVVGGQGTQGGYYDPGYNYANPNTDTNGAPLMIYALSRGIQVSADDCRASGTSLGAPQVGNVIVQALAANPDLSLAQVMQAFMQASKANAHAYWSPTSDDIDQAIVDLFYSALTITTTGTGTGTVTATPTGPVYMNGTVVKLTAVPASDSEFAGWSGDASGTAATINITMNADKSVSATFNLKPPPPGTVEVSVIGSGTVTSFPDGRINCPAESCSTTYTQNDYPFLNATPAAGYYFFEWTSTTPDYTPCIASSCPLTPNDFQNGLQVTAIFLPY